MSIRVAIEHKTEYNFDRPIVVSPHVLRLRPAPHSRTAVTAYTLKVFPQEHFINWQQDPFGNYEARLVFPGKTRKLSFDVEVIAEMTAYNPFDFFVEEYAESFPFTYQPELKGDLGPYLKKLPLSKELGKWLQGMPTRSMPTNDFLVEVNQRLQKEIEYDLRFEPGVQSPTQTLKLRRGSCRDFAWLLVQVFRHIGLAARFVSGYLVQLTQDVKSLDGPSGAERDFTDLHAWCEVYLPGAGWVGLDPTSGLFASEGHIPLSCTPNPAAAAPVTGAIEKCEVTFSYSNEVTRIHEDPRVTRPYTEDQWQSIDALGKLVDNEFSEKDVRLTMGGEPTFVSVDDMESAQWNTDALGKDKLKLAKDLLLRLRDRFAPGGMLHYGQGKWYPGEEVPRWALGCFWRTDGQPLWHKPGLLAHIHKDYEMTVGSAETFMHRLAAQIDVDEKYVNPVYENSLYYIWLEESLPTNVDPYDPGLSDSLERKRLAQVLRQGVDKSCGYVLPISWDFEADAWFSTTWELKAGRVILIPGDSPIGLRLPLDSLPEVSEEQVERDPFDEREDLDIEIARYADSRNNSHTSKPSDTVTREVVRTSLCVEARDGRLHIFMPPLQYLEHYLDLIAQIENVADELTMPVIIEGYEPPRDSRLQKLLVTPDPGVIEVNIHPASNWEVLRSTTQTLYEEAHLCRLATEKFMLDGRHTGTGGGNHVTLGGATPNDSPLLRRPDLVRSLVTYWQHHPGLSYLFSGMFIGPTSQAPRVDEGRDETLYELEIAFQQMPDGLTEQPWLVDRLMRNLLIDVTGNTHRSEFCIDKLYSPGTASGRQGILEFRGFEMPPHYRMSLVQILLLRCLVARFWQAPYKKNLIRWGTRLHDDFMLPHFVWSDIKDVVRDLNDHGYPFQIEWLLPFEEFRFPHYGHVQLEDIRVELRWAIEPWHVLGEEVSSFGTSRYVDSSVERLQVRVTGFVEGRHLLTCNGRRVPIRPTGRHGEFIAAVRYKAWQPPSALHPAMPPQAPLVFDVVDSWNGRAIGGCTYHVSHAGGRSYDTFPVNAVEAESRRINRFWTHGHTPGGIAPASNLRIAREFFANQYVPRPMTPPLEEPSDEYPTTLDLRKSQFISNH
jgi:uncharacterized protein (DUF2126 family)/transglutaminase-like putative cysteine protease